MQLLESEYNQYLNQAEKQGPPWSMTPNVCGTRHVLNKWKNIKKIGSKAARNVIDVNIKLTNHNNSV